MLGKLLGKGSDGEVYEMEGDLCVKYVQPKVCGIENFLECYIMLYTDHPNIVKAEDIEVTKYDLVKIVQKRAVSNLCKRTKNKRKIFKQIVEAVNFLSKHNIIHGDIKPSNILIYEDETVKLNDLSLCRFVESKSKKQLYTFHYRAREVDSGNISLKADVYALGCTLYEIYFNEPYHDKRFPTRLHVEKQPTFSSKVFLDLIYNMTNEDVEKRYNISQVCNHKYFAKEVFTKYNQITFENYERLGLIARELDLSNTFVYKCMNEKTELCVDYKDVDMYISQYLNFRIFDYIFKNENLNNCI
jgi:serine/threonine protein kinase